MRYETAILMKVCRITAGFPFKRADFTGEAKVIKTGDVTTDGIDIQALSAVNASAYDPKRMNQFLAREGDCVLTILGPREDIVRIAKVSGGEAYVNQGVIRLSAGPKLDGDYLFYVLQRGDFKQYIKSCLGGRKNLYVRLSALGSFPLRLPPLEEQRKMVRVLRELDERCTLNQRIAKNLEEQVCLLYRAWFERFEPFGGVMPGDWEMVPLQHLASFVDRGVVPQYAAEGAHLVLNQKCVRRHHVDMALARHLGSRHFGKKLLQYGDVLINSTGVGTLGRTAQVFFEPENLTADSHITIVRPGKDELIFYLGLWAMTHEEDFISLQVGSTSQTELPRESLRSMELLAPDPYSLRRFNKVVEPLLSCRVSALDEIRKLEQLKQQLLETLLSSGDHVDGFSECEKGF